MIYSTILCTLHSQPFTPPVLEVATEAFSYYDSREWLREAHLAEVGHTGIYSGVNPYFSSQIELGKSEIYGPHTLSLHLPEALSPNDFRHLHMHAI